MHLFIFDTIDVGICGFIGDMQFLQDCFVFLSINIWNLARFVLVCRIFFALFNELRLSCIAILHSSFHHGAGHFLIFCSLGISKALSAADIVIC